MAHSVDTAGDADLARRLARQELEASQLSGSYSDQLRADEELARLLQADMDESAGQGLDSNFTGSAEGSNSSCYPGPGSLPASSTHALETNDEQPPAYELLDILPQDSGPSVTVPSEQTNASPWANTPLLPPRPTNLSLSPYPIQSAFASPSSPSMPPLHIESIPAILEFNLFRGLRRDVTVIAADRVTCLYFLDYAPPQWRTWCRSLRRWGPSGQLLYHIRKTENNFEFLPGDAMTQGFSMQRTPKLTITKFEFTGPDMLRYAWKIRGDINQMTLQVYPSKQIVAVYRYNATLMDTRDVIEVYLPAQHMQDLVIATALATHEGEAYQMEISPHHHQYVRPSFGFGAI